MSFRTPELYNTIARGRENGKLGLRFDKQKLGEVLPSDDFPRQYNIKSKNVVRNSGHENIVSQADMERVKFKENAVDIAGMEAGVVNDFAFRGKAPMKYDPFANAVGMISDGGGENRGSLEEFDNKKEPQQRQQFNPSAQKFIRIGKQIPIVAQPNIRPPVLAPEGLKQTASGFNMKIKS